MKLLNCLAATAAALTLVCAAAQPAAAQTTARPASGGAAATTAPRTTPGTRVAVIDLQVVLDNHRRFKAANDLLVKDKEQLDAQLRNDQKALKGMIDGLKDFRPGSVEYKRAEEAAAQFESNMRVQQNLKRKELAERNAKQVYQTYEEIVAAVQEFSERNEIGLVMQFQAEEIDPDNPQSILRGVSSRQVVYQRNLNITKFIVEMVNRGTPEPPVDNNETAGKPRRPTIPGGGGTPVRRE